MVNSAAKILKIFLSETVLNTLTFFERPEIYQTTKTNIPHGENIILKRHRDLFYCHNPIFLGIKKNLFRCKNKKGFE